jgi:hypothetical protein
VSTSEYQNSRFDPLKNSFLGVKPKKVNHMQKFESRSSEASKKLYERSEFRVAFALAFAFSQIHNRNQKIAPESSESEIQ